jgi:hypothetical protein
MRNLTIAILLLAASLWAQSVYKYDANVIFTSWNIRHDRATQEEFFRLIQQHCSVYAPPFWHGNPMLSCWIDVDVDKIP